MLAQITLPIVGTDYPNRKGPTRQFALQLLDPGNPVQLVPEPDNPADENAVAVFSVEGVQMGYLPAERAPYVGQQMRRGVVSAIFQGRTMRGSFVRIAFDGDVPSLPTAKDSYEVEPDWWPDEVWDD